MPNFPEVFKNLYYYLNSTATIYIQIAIFQNYSPKIKNWLLVTKI